MLRVSHLHLLRGRVRPVLPVLLLAAIAACNAPVPAAPTAPAVPSGTPFAPVDATPTPDVLRLWLSPALPARLRVPLETIESVGGARLEVVATPEQAQVRAGPSADVPLARWVLSVVAPFPTVRDSITLDELRLAWGGSSPGSDTLFVTPSIAAALEPVLGMPAAASVRLVDPGALVDAAWGARPSLAVVAFEDLEPRWKVLALDGRSPIAGDFQPEGYPLAVPFGLSGEADGIARLQAALGGGEGSGWPETNRDPAKLTSLMMTGVTALTRATAWRMEQRGLLYPAEQIGDWLRRADLTHVSNEVAFTGDCPRANPSPKIMRFCSPLDAIQLLDSVGVDIVELTGNHVNDFGTDPLRTTLDLYQERGWGVFGGGRTLEDSMQPALVEHHGNRFAFLGCNPAGPPEAWATAADPGATPCDMERLLASVRDLKAQGYITVFTFQWAESARTAPLPAQVEAFRAAVDAGADIVQGSQAHQPQTLEFYGDSLIHYGLGNLFFDQMQSLPNRQEVLDRHVIYDGRWISTELYTALLMDWAQPRPMTAEERAAFLDEIFRLSGW